MLWLHTVAKNKEPSIFVLHHPIFEVKLKRFAKAIQRIKINKRDIIGYKDRFEVSMRNKTTATTTKPPTQCGQELQRSSYIYLDILKTFEVKI